MEIGHWIAIASVILAQAAIFFRWTAGVSERLVRMETQQIAMKESIQRIENSISSRSDEIHEVREEVRKISDEVRDIDVRVRILGRQTPAVTPQG